MPLTTKGKKIMKNMQKQYGEKKAKQVFYASANKGTIKGVHKNPVQSPTLTGASPEALKMFYKKG